MSELQVIPQQEIRPMYQPRLTAAEIKADFDLILQVMKTVMVEGMDYGKIPGCGDKPTLFKPGAEKLNVTFRLNGEPIIEDLGGPEEARYRIKTQVVHIPTGQVVGYGVGEASSDEEKYKWRKVISPAEWEATPEDRKRIKYARDYTVQQVRTNIADIRNTILKMADKRSYISATLKSTAASSVFTQDLEDLNEDLRSVVAEEDKPKTEPIQTPKAKEAAPAAAAPAPATNGQKPTPAKDRMRSMGAKFEGKCKACGKGILAGDPIFYDADTKGAYHPQCC